MRRVMLAALIVLAAGSAYAQSSLGIGGGEQAITPSTGILGGFFTWVGTEQRALYRSMTAALSATREDGTAGWLLAGLSFMYGILHAVGPGHGKVVISSYMLANETVLRRGVLLSFASSALQAISAIVIVGVGYAVLRGTTVSMTDASIWVEYTSYVLIIAFGIWLLLRKLRGLLAKQEIHIEHSHAHHGHNHSHEPALAFAHAGGHAHSHDHAHTHNHGHIHDHAHDHGEVCSTCGHAHMPSPSDLAKPLDWKSAAAAVAAVGIRPCTGAVIVLSFAVLNGLYVAGIMSVFAMALGTAITVSVLATIAVTAKNTALRFSGSAVMSARLHNGIEIVGASLLVVLGALMLAGALAV